MAIDLEDIKRQYEASGAFGPVGRSLVARYIPELITEIERLRAELTTTLIACERCGRGVPPKYAIAGDNDTILCVECGQRELESIKGIAKVLSEHHRRDHDQRVRLEERVKRLEGEREHWIDKAAELTEMLVELQEPE